jgi:Ni/Fe-hydrogenase subunit HybB-like protein
MAVNVLAVVRERKLLTPFNVVAGLMLAVGLPVMVLHFLHGHGHSTNLTDLSPWGILIGLNLLSGVALAAGGYTIATVVYIFGLKKYYPIVRLAILEGFIGYLFVVVALIFDLGRPWRLPYPMVYSYGVTSVMFLIAWHVALYLTVQFLEFSPAVFEWLGWKRLRDLMVKLTIGATAFGVILSTLHQSALGALFLMAPSKIHPLWYSSFIPVYFFISSIAAGISIIIVVAALYRRTFREIHGPSTLDDITLGLGRAAAVVLFTYFFLKLVGVADGQHWALINTPLGQWFLVEMFIFVLLPSLLFSWGAQTGNVAMVRLTALLTVVGICINRLNISLIAMNWSATGRYFPHWMELVISLTVITIGILTFQWIVRRMPVIREHPDFSWDYK